MSLFDASETSQIAPELVHSLIRAEFARSALNDRPCRYMGAWCECPGESHVNQDFHAEENPALVSSSYGSFDYESGFEAIAAEAPQELFNNSRSMQEFAKRNPAREYRSIPLQYFLQDEEVVVPTVAGIDLGRRDIRHFLWETAKEVGQIWNSESRATLPGLMVIDCFSRRVVTAEPHCRYVALSYVWGSITSRGEDEQFEQDLRGLRLPRTVQDAMNVVRVLGMRFLWVDRYCINDTEPGMKHYTINNMGAIYGAADLTIIAAAGSDGEHGLPSVSRSCNVLDEGDMPPWNGIVSTKVPHMSLERIETSAWSTRGWTYQEGLLSPRRLIFTDDSAILHCRGEDRVRVSSGIFAHINEYSRRRLTYPSDLLKAFLGVLRAYERLQPAAMHVWGVPFLLDSDRNIRQPGYGLLWRAGRPGSSLHRIQGLPSWTWAGWNGWSDHDAAHSPFMSYFYHVGPYRWLVYNASLQEGPRYLGHSDISLELLVGDQVTNISDYFRANHRLPSGQSEEPAPILYLTAWSTTVIALLSPNLAVYLPGVDMGGAIATLDQTVESMYNGEPVSYGHWGCEWTAVIISWSIKGHTRTLRTQSLLLEQAGEDTFRRVGVLETDWHKSDFGQGGRIAASGRTFTRTCLRVV